MKWQRRKMIAQLAMTRFSVVACLFACPALAYADNTPPFNVQGIEFTPSAGIFSGYSSNPDESIGGQSSSFIQYDAGLKAVMKSGASILKAEVHGTILNYDGLEKDHRWLYEAKASGVSELTTNDLLEYDVRRRRDNLDDKYDQLSHRVRAFWTHTAKDFELKVGSTFRNKDFLVPDTHNEFDYLSPGSELILRALPKAELSPFMILRGAKLDYLNQVESVVDRDAENYSITGGWRWQPSKTVEIDIGSRYNLRVLEDRTYSRIENNYIDLQLQWKPSAEFEAKAAVWRELAEPYMSDGVAADQINYELGFVLNPADRWQLEGKGTFQWEHEIGSEVKSSDIELTAAVYYEINPSLRTFLKGRQLWETDRNSVDHSVEHSETTEIFMGFETTF